VWYDTDENQVRQIVWNLATNGLRAMPTGGRLRLAARTDAPAGIERGHLVLTVEDQGVGMTPDALDGIFQPFRGTFPKGTGLGLAIVHRIVSDHDGEGPGARGQGPGRGQPSGRQGSTAEWALTLTPEGTRGQPSRPRCERHRRGGTWAASKVTGT
jgi:signal transduction histidine kinase